MFRTVAFKYRRCRIIASMLTKEEYDAVYLLSKMQYLPESEKMAGCLFFRERTGLYPSVEENPTYEELKKWQARSGLPIKKFFNTSGMLYKEMQLKDKLPQMSEDEQLKLLATNGMLVKRPVIVDGDTVLTGFREKEWEEKLR